jgi:hypothetical protein
MQFLCCPGDCGCRDSEVAGQITGALLELRAPFTVGGADNSQSQFESLGLLAGVFLAGAFLGFFSAEASAAASASGAGLLSGEALSTAETPASGVSKSACDASAVKVFTVIGVAFSS